MTSQQKKLQTAEPPLDAGLDQRHEAELEQHIQDCGWHMKCSYARFEAFGNPADRDAALQWLWMQQDAIRARSAAAQARRHAEFERRLDDGVDFFQSEYALQLGRQVGGHA